jgi:hypothetical protein
VLAVGAIFAGYLAEEYFVGADRGEFWKHAILVLPQHDSIAKAEELTGIIEFLPLIAGALGIATAYLCYSIEPDIPARLAMQYRALYRFCSTNGTSTSFMTGCSSTAFTSARAVEDRRRQDHRLSRPEYRRRHANWRASSRLQTGYVTHDLPC